MNVHEKTIDILESAGFEPYNNAPWEQTTGYLLVKGAVEEILKSAQQRLHLTAIAACGLGVLIGLGIGWLWFGA